MTHTWRHAPIRLGNGRTIPLDNPLIDTRPTRRYAETGALVRIVAIVVLAVVVVAAFFFGVE